MFKTNKVWHSQLLGVSPLKVMFTSAPMQDRFNKDNTIAFFRTEEDGTDSKRYLVIENDHIAEEVKNAPKNKWVTVDAGGAGDSATIGISVSDSGLNLGGDGGPVNAGVSASGGGGGANSSNGRYGPASVLETYRETLNLVREEFPDCVGEDGALTDQGEKHVAFLFIQFYKTGRFMPLYPGQKLESEYGEEGVEEEVPYEGKEEAGRPSDKAMVLQELFKQVSWSGVSHDENELKAIKKRMSQVIAEGTDQEFDSAIAWCQAEKKYQQEVQEEENDGLPF